MRTRSTGWKQALSCVSLFTLVALVACDDNPATGPDVGSSGLELATATDPGGLEFDVTHGDFRVCKSGSSADFTVTVTEDGDNKTADNPSFSLNDGECDLAHSDVIATPVDEVTITETAAQEGFQLDSIVVYTLPDEQDPEIFREKKLTGTNTISGVIDAGKLGCTVIFYNSPVEDVGTGTPGYWMNHPDAWPVEEIEVGGVTYTVAEAIEEMKKSGKGDKTYTMFDHLVSAKLNVALGTDASCISDTIADADAWMVDNPLGSGVRGGSPEWRDEGEALKDELDDYNNGLLCAPSRDSLEE